MKLHFFVALFLTVCSLISLSGQSQDEDLPPGWWQIPNTSTNLKLGGYVKFDLIHDFNPIGSPDFFDVTTIPTDGSEGSSSNLNAKETRLNLDFTSKIKETDIRAFVEGDFYGEKGAFRLRHAFVEIGRHWLAGQWWSNFMDESIIPATLDFEKPGAYLFARHPMLRYKAVLSEDSYLALALEQPNKNAQSPAASGSFYSPLPDLNARYRMTREWGHVQLSAFIATLRYEFDAGGNDNVTLYGANLSGRLNLFKADYLIYQAAYGPGVARYRGGLSAGLNEEGELEALSDYAYTIGYQHQWVDKLTSLVVYNHGEVDNTGGQPDDAAKRGNYLATNLIWHFIPKAFVGVEYLHGTRTDKNGADGSANRMQFSVKYTFN